MTYEVIATGSTGNAVLLGGKVLIDCGVPWKALQPYAKRLAVVLLTHRHSDHFNAATVHALAKARPALRWGCCEWMVEPLLASGVSKRNIDVLTPGYVSEYSFGYVQPERLVHDVPNCGYHIFWANGERVFYATDTGTLDGITAKGYDLYLVEANHTREEIEERIARKQEAGEYAYEFRAARNHLSYEQARDWIYEQMGSKSQYAFLHQHKEETKHDPMGTDILQSAATP